MAISFRVIGGGGSGSGGSSGSTGGTTYRFVFNESGLKSGLTWGVTFNGQSKTATAGSSIIFQYPAGAYTYTYHTVSGYTTPKGGTTARYGGSFTGTYYVTTTGSGTTTTGSGTTTTGSGTMTAPNYHCGAVAITCHIKQAIADALYLSGTYIQPVFGSAVKDVGNGLSTGFQDAFHNIIKNLPLEESVLKQALQPIYSPIVSKLHTIESDIANIPNDISTGFTNLGSDISNIGSDISSGIATGVSDAVKDVFGAGSTIYTHVIKPIIDGFQNVFGNIYSTLSTYLQDIYNTLTNIPSDLSTLGTDIKNIYGKVKSFITNFVSNMKKALGHFFNTYVKTPLQTFYNNKILPAIDYVKTNYLDPFISHVKSFIKDFKTFVGYVSTIGGDIITGIKDVGADTKKAYDFLVAKPYYLPNWAWILIGGVGVVTGGAIAVTYGKGYFQGLGKRAAMHIKLPSFKGGRSA